MKKSKEEVETARFEKVLRECVEPGVLDVVLLLNRAGIETVSSCEGGRGHQSKWPLISCQPGPENMERARKLLTRVLLRAGYRRFNVQTHFCYGLTAEVEEAFLEVEFYDRKPVRPAVPPKP